MIQLSKFFVIKPTVKRLSKCDNYYTKFIDNVNRRFSPSNITELNAENVQKELQISETDIKKVEKPKGTKIL